MSNSHQLTWGALLWENPKSLLNRSIQDHTFSKETEESLPRVHFSGPLMHHDPGDLGFPFGVFAPHLPKA